MNIEKRNVFPVKKISVLIYYIRLFWLSFNELFLVRSWKMSGSFLLGSVHSFAWNWKVVNEKLWRNFFHAVKTLWIFSLWNFWAWKISCTTWKKLPHNFSFQISKKKFMTFSFHAELCTGLYVVISGICLKTVMEIKYFELISVVSHILCASADRSWQKTHTNTNITIHTYMYANYQMYFLFHPISYWMMKLFKNDMK